jgi:PAS domain S-box-containing protein
MPFGLFANYFILTYIPFSHLMKEVFSHFEKVDREKKWHRLVDHANVIIVVLNRMGHVDFVNPFFLKLTGYKEAEVIGKDWFEFFVPSDQYYDVQSAFIEILEFDFHPNYRNPIITKYQEKRMIDWYNVRLRDANDHVTGSVSIGIDITDDDAEMSSLKQKLAEAEELINQMRKEGKIS